MSELELLTRAHELFTGSVRPVRLDAGTAQYGQVLDRAAGLNPVGGHEQYRLAVDESREALRSAARTDAVLARLVQQAQQDHTTASRQTRDVLEEARADRGASLDSPLAQRDAMRRRAARLRAQHAHVTTARRRARRRSALLRALRYRALRRAMRLNGLRLAPPNSRAGIAVRAALSRLGRPYVWGATGPNQFDCSGLVQWAYNIAGIHLDRTTYDQIHDGVPVPRSQVRPGDLVFPHAGHVQMAIGNDQVVEAPHAGATVRISQLGTNVQIRRPV